MRTRSSPPRRRRSTAEVPQSTPAPRSKCEPNMPINILMPALSPTMEKGNLSRWLKKEGDKVKSGDILAEIETDKATMEVEAVDEGVLAKIVVPDGTTDVPVNEVIGVIAGEGEDASAATPAAPAPAAPASPATPAPAAPAPSRPAACRGKWRRRQWPCGATHLRLAAGAAHRQGGRPRTRRDCRQRPAWPHHRARRQGGAGAAPAAAAPKRHRPLRRRFRRPPPMM